MILDRLVSSFSSVNDEIYDEYDGPDFEEDNTPVMSKKETAPVEDERAKRATANKVSPIGRTKKVQGGNGMEVCVIKPTSVDDGREITQTLLANRTVVLNLEGIDVNIAQRIIDFASGSTYAIGGSLQKISQYIFILTPASVDISGDIQGVFDGAFDS